MAEKVAAQGKNSKTEKSKSARKSTKAAAQPAVVAKRAVSPAKKPAAKTASRRSLSRGDNLVCGVCGLSVIVDEFGDVIATEEVFCCGETMKKRAGRAKTTKK